LKLLFLAQRIPYPPNKGEKIRTFFQINHLVKQGHHVDIVFSSQTTEDNELGDAIAKLLSVGVIKEKLNYRWFRLLSGLLRNIPLSVCNFENGKLLKRLRHTVRNTKYDAIICTSSSMAEYVFKSGLNMESLRSGKRPMLVMDFMDLDSDKWLQYAHSSPWPMKWIYKREAILLAKYENKIQRNFDHCFFISQNEVDLFSERNGSSQNVHVLGNGINIDAYHPADHQPENEDPVFIFTGVMDYKPNVDAVIWFAGNVWPLILEHFPKSRFFVAGMNPTTSIGELAKTTGIEITGFVDDILPYYHQSNYFVAPLRIARGVQNKVLQAFACGLPVISSKMGAEGIACVDGEHIMIASTGEDYLKAVQKLEADKIFKAALIANALDLVKSHYSWEGQLKVLDEILLFSSQNK
jgi:polysaccharide biosynthesis protein PslH